ncbi:MAG: hypothetical protein MOB07_17295, partial [Acidobacteria bacterium]|nr:hypothetical protein [Acidobacteriota bacterium]
MSLNERGGAVVKLLRPENILPHGGLSFQLYRARAQIEVFRCPDETAFEMNEREAKKAKRAK